MDHESNKVLAQNYITRKGKCWFVSTIDRESSALEGGRYAETLVWLIDPNTKMRTKIVGQAEAPEGSTCAHHEMCDRLYKTGNPDKDGDEWTK